MPAVAHPILTNVASVILYILWFITYNLILPRRFRLSVTLLLEALYIPIYFLITLLPTASVARSILGAVLIACLVLALYKGPWYAKLFVSAVPLAIVMTCEFLTLLALGESGMDSAALSTRLITYALYLFLNLILLTFFVFAARMVQKRRRGEVIGQLSLLFVLYPISQYIAILGWFTPLSDGVHTDRPLVFLLALGLFIIADVGLVVAFNASARSAELRLKTEMLEQQAAAQKEQYAALAEHYDEMRRLRHDIDNHLYTIRSLLDDGKLSDASQYAQALSDSFSALRPGLELCENTAAASYLLHKKKELEAKGVALSCAATLPAALGLGEPDLICILGNLLDNAEEACVGLDGAEIRLCAAFAEPYLSFQVSNPCRPAPERKPRRISALSRGIGTEILRRYAARYDGSYSSTQEDGQFHASLVLRL